MADATTRRATKARHDALVALLQEGVDGVETLAERVGVSPSTVRRDLGRLQKEGRIARTYGGALVRDVFHERSFGESALINQRAKAAIASVAVGLLPSGPVPSESVQEPSAGEVRTGPTVFLDAGTTCLALARLLAERGPMTVVTRGLEAALLLARAPGVDVVMLGGHVQPLSHGVVGPLSSLAFERLVFDVAFLGADAVDPVTGLGEPTVEETYVKEQATVRAKRVALLADASKLGPANVPAWIPLDPAWTLVTDAGVSRDIVDTFTARGVEVLTAG